MGALLLALGRLAYPGSQDKIGVVKKRAIRASLLGFGPRICPLTAA